MDSCSLRMERLYVEKPVFILSGSTEGGLGDDGRFLTMLFYPKLSVLKNREFSVGFLIQTHIIPSAGNYRWGEG